MEVGVLEGLGGLDGLRKGTPSGEAQGERQGVEKSTEMAISMGKPVGFLGIQI